MKLDFVNKLLSLGQELDDAKVSGDEDEGDLESGPSNSSRGDKSLFNRHQKGRASRVLSAKNRVQVNDDDGSLAKQSWSGSFFRRAKAARINPQQPSGDASSGEENSLLDRNAAAGSSSGSVAKKSWRQRQMENEAQQRAEEAALAGGASTIAAAAAGVEAAAAVAVQADAARAQADSEARGVVDEFSGGRQVSYDSTGDDASSPGKKLPLALGGGGSGGGDDVSGVGKEVAEPTSAEPVAERGYDSEDEFLLNREMKGRLAGVESIVNVKERQWAAAGLEGTVVRRLKVSS